MWRARLGTLASGWLMCAMRRVRHTCRYRNSTDASSGYKCVIYMPDTQSQEKIDLLKALGAIVRPVPAVPVTDPNNYNWQARDYAAELSNGEFPAHLAQQRITSR